MAIEILMEYTLPLVADGASYIARACGREREDGFWEGWLEFEDDRGLLLHTERETTQSNHANLLYWAGGLEGVYLEGALERALRLHPVEQILIYLNPSGAGRATD
jgi:hypothetical protein